ncbi:hypothetical protein BV511_16110 [Methylorubrum extorquens]|uniref:ribbon-helix-helix domain-containing protein n=1 Tax=Methylorubrum extorquens TaxID=408 RepID=UPI000972911C|nr:type II toxin-antitoxin system ParD family antitoxin [Methylorubrum extorquens]APX86082.1 hypothetical protein BV511_16110 [Methylorubrum extorquens]
MPAKHSCHIALPEALASWIDAQVAKGEYASTSDLVRTAVRVLRSRDDEEAARSAPSARPARGTGEA